MNEIEKTVAETMTVAPSPEEERRHHGDAGRDESIAERLQKDPENSQARLDRGLDESMDASDPPATTQPIHNHNPAPSSGYDEAAERERDA